MRVSFGEGHGEWESGRAALSPEKDDERHQSCSGRPGQRQAGFPSVERFILGDRMRRSLLATISVAPSARPERGIRIKNEAVQEDCRHQGENDAYAKSCRRLQFPQLDTHEATRWQLSCWQVGLDRLEMKEGAGPGRPTLFRPLFADNVRIGRPRPCGTVLRLPAY